MMLEKMNAEQHIGTKKNANHFGDFAEITANLKKAADSATQAVASTVKQASESINQYSFSMGEPTDSPVSETVSPSAGTQLQGAKFCSNCGTPINAGARFCHVCGSRISENSAQTSLPVTPAVPSSVVEQEPQQKHTERRQQEYVGTILKCPNCGATISETTVICPECGMRITGRAAVRSVQAFQEQLMAIEMKRKKTSLWMSIPRAANPADNQKLSLIRSFPIPNTIDDIQEFMLLAVANIEAKLSKNTVGSRFNSFMNSGNADMSMQKALSDAWVSKMQQAYQKAEIMFPNDPAFPGLQRLYFDKMKELKIKV